MTVAAGRPRPRAFDHALRRATTRTMTVTGDRRPLDARRRVMRLARRTDWVHVAPLCAATSRPRRSRRSPEGGGSRSTPRASSARPARAAGAGRRLRPGRARPVSMLKLSEEEARSLAGGFDARALARLGVPEVVVTLGSRGCDRLHGRRRRAAAAPRRCTDASRRALVTRSWPATSPRAATARRRVEAARRASVLSSRCSRSASADDERRARSSTVARPRARSTSTRTRSPELEDGASRRPPVTAAGLPAAARRRRPRAGSRSSPSSAAAAARRLPRRRPHLARVGRRPARGPRRRDLGRASDVVSSRPRSGSTSREDGGRFWHGAGARAAGDRRGRAGRS